MVGQGQKRIHINLTGKTKSSTTFCNIFVHGECVTRRNSKCIGFFDKNLINWRLVYIYWNFWRNGYSTYANPDWSDPDCHDNYQSCRLEQARSEKWIPRNQLPPHKVYSHISEVKTHRLPTSVSYRSVCCCAILRYLSAGSTQLGLKQKYCSRARIMGSNIYILENHMVFPRILCFFVLSLRARSD